MNVRFATAMLVVSLMSCKQKQSPDELVALLSKTGAKIGKDGAYTNEPPAEIPVHGPRP
jgi:hypothetical protein